MIRRCVVNYADGKYEAGQARLQVELSKDESLNTVLWSGVHTPGKCASHREQNYQFKAYALRSAARAGYWTLLWCDASVVPIRSLTPLWEKIERDGYWISRNREYMNYEWTADLAYPLLGVTREENAKIPHVMATAFGVSLSHPLGRQIYDEYFRLANNGSFNGPWKNKNHPDYRNEPEDWRCGPCGPENVRGHRHDQTALSVIAWKLGLELSVPPEWMEYKGQETEKTVLLVDGDY